MARGLIVATSLFLAACAEPGPPTLAVDTVTAALPAAVWPDDPSAVTDVACPNLDTALIAQTTQCEARVRGELLTIDVVVDESGLTRSTVREPLFDVGAAAEQIAARLSTDLAIPREDLAVACDTTVVVARAGAIVPCTGDRSGDLIRFDLELVDGSGNWTLRYGS